MDTPIDVAAPAAADSSPAPQTVEVPREAKAYEQWRQTGKLPGEAKPQREKSAPSKESSEPSDKDGESSSVSETGDKQGERKRSNAETRLNELLADLKRSGLTPSELKTFKKEAQAAAAGNQPAAPEHTEKPAEAKPPGYESIKPKPLLEDFDGIEAWADALTDWKADAREWTNSRKAAADKQTKEITESLSSAKGRYGETAEATIRDSAAAIFNDAQVPHAIKAIVNDSPVMVDLLYAIGSKEDMKEFVQLAKSKPNEAIRKAVLMERLIADELRLAKVGDDSTEASTTERGADGQFVSGKPPAKKVTQAPPPPKEAAGRQAAPANDVDSAAKANDFSTFRAAANRRDVARHNGR